MTAQSTSASSDDSLQNELSKRGREVWLAGLGALATVEEEGTKLFGGLVDRGKQFEQERREDLKEATQKARKQGDQALSQFEEASEETQSLLLGTVHSALERFGVPTQNEIDRLSTKVDALSKQVDALSEALSEERPASNESDE
ncbi:MAG: protein PhaF [Bacteroidetes bacterium SW_9_63_38]|nr:MAG: protein PhaF [Bacteroidetes bacterium SW_9_63_38]